MSSGPVSFRSTPLPAGTSVFGVDRRLAVDVDGAFIAFGAGSDIDAAFDVAVTGERFDIGSAGLVPSLVDIDPSAVRDVLPGPVHPFHGLGMLRSRLAAVEPGTVLALAVTSPSAWKIARTRVQFDDVTAVWPDAPGLLVPTDEASREFTSTVARATAGLAESVLWLELVATPRRRYKINVGKVTGPLERRFAVIRDECVVSVHANASEARRAAVTMAKEASGPLELHVRPHISRGDGQPFLRIERALVSQRAVVKVASGSLRNPDKVKTTGWLFAGRRPV